MNSKKIFNYLIKASFALFALLLIWGIALKAIMPKDLIANYNFLSTMSLRQRLVRGLKLIEFYKIEAQIGVIKKTLLLDFLNLAVFVPFGIFTAGLFQSKRVLKAFIVSFLFSLIIELFQLSSVIGSFMLNDLILNTLGGALGAVIYLIVTRGERYKIYNVLLIIFLTLAFLIFAYLLFNFASNIDIYIAIIAK